MAEAEVAPSPVHKQQGGGLADPLLDRRESDQFCVELAQDFRDPGALVFCRKIDRGPRRGSGFVRHLLTSIA